MKKNPTAAERPIRWPKIYRQREAMSTPKKLRKLPAAMVWPRFPRGLFSWIKVSNETTKTPPKIPRRVRQIIVGIK